MDKTCVHVWYQIKFADKGIKTVEKAKEYIRFLVMPRKSRMHILNEMVEMGLIKIRDNRIEIIGYKTNEEDSEMDVRVKRAKQLKEMEVRL